jgi:hypothetical protein
MTTSEQSQVSEMVASFIAHRTLSPINFLSLSRGMYYVKRPREDALAQVRQS